MSAFERLSAKRWKCAESTVESSARCVLCNRSSTNFMKRAALAHAVRMPARFVSSLRGHTCTRAAREAISDNHTVCWSAHSADCRALPSRSISSDAFTTRPSPGLRSVWAALSRYGGLAAGRWAGRCELGFRVSRDPTMPPFRNFGSRPGARRPARTRSFADATFLNLEIA